MYVRRGSPCHRPANPCSSLPWVAMRRAHPACAFSSGCDQRYGFPSLDSAQPSVRAHPMFLPACQTDRAIDSRCQGRTFAFHYIGRIVYVEDLG